MADAVINNIIVDGTRRIISMSEWLTDGDEATDLVLYDYSADANKPTGTAPGDVRILRCWMNSMGGATAGKAWIEFDGSTDQAVLGLDTSINCTAALPDRLASCGGMGNGAGSPTGDVTLSTLAMDTGDTIMVFLEILKG